jgi:hypothetical protein
MADQLPDTLPPGKRPRTHRIQRYMTLDQEACEVLDELAPGMNKRGDYVSRLVLEERARREERQRLKAQLAAAPE